MILTYKVNVTLTFYPIKNRRNDAICLCILSPLTQQSQSHLLGKTNTPVELEGRKLIDSHIISLILF
jgi:hypothetical protein